MLSNWLSTSSYGDIVQANLDFVQRKAATSPYSEKHIELTPSNELIELHNLSILVVGGQDEQFIQMVLPNDPQCVKMMMLIQRHPELQSYMNCEAKCRYTEISTLDEELLTQHKKTKGLSSLYNGKQRAGWFDFFSGDDIQNIRDYCDELECWTVSVFCKDGKQRINLPKLMLEIAEEAKVEQMFCST